MKTYLNLLIILIFNFNIISISFGHVKHKPIRGTSIFTTDSEEEKNYLIAGYGYVATSEAEAEAMLSRDCRKETLLQEINSVCKFEKPFFEDPYSLLKDSLSPIILTKLQEHDYEYCALQKAANNLKRTSDTFPAPNCLSHNPEINSFFEKLPIKSPKAKEIVQKKPDQRLVLNKLKAVESTMASGNLIRAIILYDHLNYIETTNCLSALDSMCTDIKFQKDKLRHSFPLVSTPKVSTLKITQNLYKLLDLKFGNGEGKSKYLDLTGPNADIIELEKMLGEQMIKKDFKTKNIINELNKSIENTRKEYEIKLNEDLKQICNKTIKDYMKERPNIVRQLMNDSSPSERLSTRLVLCSQDNLVKKNSPQIDCNGITKKNYTDGTVLRISNFSYSHPFASNVDYKILIPSNVDKKRIVAATLYIKKDNDIKDDELNNFLRKINKDINDYFNCQAGNIPQYENKACPQRPKINLEFHIQIKEAKNDSATPVVYLHRYYNTELLEDERSNIEKIRKYKYDQCQNDCELSAQTGKQSSSIWGVDLNDYLNKLKISNSENIKKIQKTYVKGKDSNIDVLCKKDCKKFLTKIDFNSKNPDQSIQEMDTFPLDDDECFKREDSANFTLSSSAKTLRHEILHMLGVKDEYIDPQYALLAIGEESSVMNIGDEMFERHFRKILEPELCFEDI